jgi:hypothetical protein
MLNARSKYQGLLQTAAPPLLQHLVCISERFTIAHWDHAEDARKNLEMLEVTAAQHHSLCACFC